MYNNLSVLAMNVFLNMNFFFPDRRQMYSNNQICQLGRVKIIIILNRTLSGILQGL